MVTVLMIGRSAVSLMAIATFTLPYVSRPVQIGALVVMASVFGLLQWTIYEIDNKFEGIIQVEPTDTELLADAMTSRVIEQRPDVSLPCDSQGTPR
jgi:hypothetical protein